MAAKVSAQEICSLFLLDKLPDCFVLQCGLQYSFCYRDSKE